VNAALSNAQKYLNYMNLLSQEQIETMNIAECQKQLKLLDKAYDLDKPLNQMTPEEFAQVDDVVNCLLFLEDRIRQQQIVDVAHQANIARWGPPKVKEPKVEKPGRPARKFRIGDVVYENLADAAKKTGIKSQTLKTYVSRKPDRYAYID
jgi:hypothetical protein